MFGSVESLFPNARITSIGSVESLFPKVGITSVLYSSVYRNFLRKQASGCTPRQLPQSEVSHTPAQHVQEAPPLPGAQPPLRPKLVPLLQGGSDLAGHLGAARARTLQHRDHFQNGSGAEQGWHRDAAEAAEQLGPPAGGNKPCDGQASACSSPFMLRLDRPGRKLLQRSAHVVFHSASIAVTQARLQECTLTCEQSTLTASRQPNKCRQSKLI